MFAFLLSFFSFILLSCSMATNYEIALDIPPRYQWNGNCGYCGEVSLISAGLFYGQYLSQYDCRSISCLSPPLSCSQLCRDQLLLGVNDKHAAEEMKLSYDAYQTEHETKTSDFLFWVKEHVANGHPVAIGLFTNEMVFYGNPEPNAGDPDYDHIVPVTGWKSNYPLNDGLYHGDDIITFSDNGLFGDGMNAAYNYSYECDSFQASRSEANRREAPYSLNNNAENYGIAITGIMDSQKVTVPVRVKTNLNYESPEISDGSSERPAPEALSLTVTVSNLTIGVEYNLYRYDDFEDVPTSKFNKHSSSASQSWKIQVESGSTFNLIDNRMSNQISIYRAVSAVGSDSGSASGNTSNSGRLCYTWPLFWATFITFLFLIQE